MEKKYIVDKSNRRSFYLFDLLKKEGHTVYDYDENAVFNDPCTFIFTPSKVLTKKTLDKIPADSTVFYFKKDCDKLYPSVRFVNLSTNDAFRRINSRLSAEGALALCISNTDCALLNSSLLVLGYGKLGSAVASVFAPLSAKVSVAAFTLQEANDAGRKYPTFYKREFCSTLSSFDVIINTVPANVMTAEDVASIKEGALYLELASPPYGIDPSMGKTLKAKYILGNALPDKYCPKSAGEALLSVIDKTYKEVD